MNICGLELVDSANRYMLVEMSICSILLVVGLFFTKHKDKDLFCYIGNSIITNDANKLIFRDNFRDNFYTDINYFPKIVYVRVPEDPPPIHSHILFQSLFIHQN